MKKQSSLPMAVTRLLWDVLPGPERAERMRASRLLGGVAHDRFLVRWAGLAVLSVHDAHKLTREVSTYPLLSRV